MPASRFSRVNSNQHFYNGLSENDQDSLNAAAGGYHLGKSSHEALQITENKAKVYYARSKNVSKVNSIPRENVETNAKIDKLTDVLMTCIEKLTVAPVSVKAVEEVCVTCGGPHAYYNCQQTNTFVPNVNAVSGNYQQVAPQNRSSNYLPPPGFPPTQNNYNKFNQG